MAERSTSKGPGDAGAGRTAGEKTTNQAGGDARNPMGMFMPDFDFTKAFAAMKPLTGPDTEIVLAAYRRNMEALSEANRLALEGAQAVARRHMEIMQRTMADLTEQLRSMSAGDDAQARAAKQAEMLKRGYETAVTNMREISDLIQRSNGEAVEKLNHRFSEAMDEMRKLLDKKS